MAEAKNIRSGLMIVAVMGIGAAALLGSQLLGGKQVEQNQAAKAAGRGTWQACVLTQAGSLVPDSCVNANSYTDDVSIPGTIYSNDQIRLTWNYQVNKEGVFCNAQGNSPRWNKSAVANAPEVTTYTGELKNKSGSLAFTETPGTYRYAVICNQAVNAVLVQSSDLWESGDIRATVSSQFRAQ